jgi:hypothetical protein
MTTGQQTVTLLQPSLPPNTTSPENEDLWQTYWTDTYKDIANAVNSKDFNYYPMAITSSYTNIVNLPPFGAYIICISGMLSTLPTITASLCKADATAAGSVAVLGSQVGTGAWAGNALTFFAATGAFQVKHDNTGAIGNFNLRIIGTQQVG